MSSGPLSLQYIQLPDPVALDVPNGRQYECTDIFKNTPTPGHPDWSTPSRAGLPTPPNDMNTIVYNTTFSSTYGLQPYAASLPSTYSDVTPKAHESTTSTSRRFASESDEPSVKVIHRSSALQTNTQPRTENSIASYLQIPSTINGSRGSLAEFAAQIACLFWFEETAKLKAIEDSSITMYSLVPEAIPTIGFQKWVTTILSTTQVSQNVVLLALLFIYRLKEFNPRVRGKKGSEFRLMTIALMMGNKFLDDNTYTNKTWAEVSGISVQEIHIMEVEFLSNVRYNLFISKAKWDQWHAKLGLFANFFDEASRLPRENEVNPVTPVLQISPALSSTSQASQLLSPLSKIPSPSFMPPQFPVDWMNLYATPTRTISPPRPSSELQISQYSRKRSWDDEIQQHPAKRVAVPTAYPTPASAYVPSTASSTGPVLPPVLTSVNMNPSVPAVAAPVPRVTRSAISLVSNTMLPTIPTAVGPMHLPTTRALSAVYNSSTTWPQPQPSTVVTAPASLTFNSALSIPDRGLSHTQQLGTVVGTISPTSSMATYSLPASHSNLSPSHFLVNRNSPYRPVRAVNTLLIPPPSASLHQPRNLSMQQMHYRPLGKNPSERCTGVLPIVHHDMWSQRQAVQPHYLSSHNYAS